MDKILIKEISDGQGNEMYLFQVYDGVKDNTFFQIMVNDKVIFEAEEYRAAHANYLFMVSHINCI